MVNAREFEIELGYLTLERGAGETTYITPSIVLNYGPLDTLELIAEFDLQNPRDEAWAVADPGGFLKAQLKRGVLQDEPGLSIALEVGALLLANNDDEEYVGG